MTELIYGMVVEWRSDSCRVLSKTPQDPGNCQEHEIANASIRPENRWPGGYVTV
jgi:hypothetical protein